ncbi:MAG: metalloendopeptidase [Gammaproteobacteria bacterium]|nr:MAG: metalloendopeptidase [Gammaproteobacteria bacterium]
MAEPGNARQLKAYRSVLARLETRLADIEVRTWETVQAEIEEAVELEQAASDLTREEWDVIKGYLKRDLKAVFDYLKDAGKGFKEWLATDAAYLKEEILEWVEKAADPAKVEWERLNLQLHHDDSTYVTGELTLPGILKCTECGKLVVLPVADRIQPCHRCHCEVFQRVMSYWPDEDVL